MIKGVIISGMLDTVTRHDARHRGQCEPTVFRHHGDDVQNGHVLACLALSRAKLPSAQRSRIEDVMQRDY